MLDDIQNGNHLLPSVGGIIKGSVKICHSISETLLRFQSTLNSVLIDRNMVNEGFINQFKVKSNLFIEQSSYPPLLKTVFIEGLCNFQRSDTELSEVFLKPFKRQLFPAVAAPQFLWKLRLLYSLLYTCLFQYVQNRHLFLFFSYIKSESCS